jgi:hypothetical protein
LKANLSLSAICRPYFQMKEAQGDSVGYLQRRSRRR